MEEERECSRALIVFAGGGDSASRLAKAQRHAARLRPSVVFLTGEEFAGIDSVPFSPDVCGEPLVILDKALTTLESCVLVSEEIRRRYPRRADVTAVTSNYHAPRVRWIFG